MERFRISRAATMIHPRTASEVRAIAFAASGAGANSGREFQLLPTCNFRSNRYHPQGAAAWKIDATSAAKVIAAARERSDRIVIDYENQSLRSETNGKPAPAAGWFRELEWREGKGLYAVDVELTARAKQMIEAGEYRYVSPVFRHDPATGEVLEVLTAGLTNVPGIDGMEPIPQRTAARFEGSDLTAAAKAEFENSAALREEFLDFRTYAAFRKADAQGKVRICGRRNVDDLSERAAARFEDVDVTAAAKAEFESDAALRAEFVDLRTYTAWRKAHAQGKVKIFGHSRMEA